MSSPGVPWNVPYPRNPCFTGRDEILSRLQDQFQKGPAAALPQAIGGLGGIGKTQIAIEYAYQHRQDYQAVLWSRADTHEALVSGYVEMAQQLNLPQKDEQDQTLVVKAVLQWFKTQTQWLLILDNADELTIVREFLPPTFGGHILLTTRAQSVGRLAHGLEVETMDRDNRDMGALLLLRRANLVAPDASLEAALPSDIALAKEITEELGGLPLALDQAGAYIEKIPCSLLEYQRLYRTRGVELLNTREDLVGDHPDPVATTWSLSFQRVEEQNAAAADLLRLCAYLAPDAIPEEILTQGAKHLGSVLQAATRDLLAWNKAIAALSAYSLIRRNVTSQTISVHRLVQAVLRDQMTAEEAKAWTRRAVQAVETAFPAVAHEAWPQCEHLLSHALTCWGLTKQYALFLPETAALLRRAGWYLLERARYSEAEPLLQDALALQRQLSGPTHPDTATGLNDVAELLWRQGKYSQAQPFVEQALAIREPSLGLSHLDTATSLNDLAVLHYQQGRYAEAEPLFKRALSIREQQLGAEHPETASGLSNLARLYQDQGKYEQAEPLLKRALSIYEQQLGAEHPYTQTVRRTYAILLQMMGRDEEATQLEEGS